MESPRRFEQSVDTEQPVKWRDVRPDVVDDEAEVAVRRSSLLAAFRRRAGRTQRDVAEQMGVSQARVSAIEGNDVTATEVATLVNYAQALGAKVKIAFVIDGEERAVFLG